MEARLVRLTPGELEGYLARLASLTSVVRWNGVPVGLQEAVHPAGPQARHELADRLPEAREGRPDGQRLRPVGEQPPRRAVEHAARLQDDRVRHGGRDRAVAHPLPQRGQVEHRRGNGVGEVIAIGQRGLPFEPFRRASVLMR